MNFSLKQLFLMAIISSLYTATVLPTKYRDHKHAQQQRELNLRKLRKSGVNRPTKKISKKWLNASYVRCEMTNKPALYDIPNEIDLMGRELNSTR